VQRPSKSRKFTVRALKTVNDFVRVTQTFNIIVSGKIFSQNFQNISKTLISLILNLSSRERFILKTKKDTLTMVYCYKELLLKCPIHPPWKSK